MYKAALLCLACSIAVPAFADLLNMQAGLWEMKAVKTVIDGKDQSAQISDAQAKMQAAMASMTPEQRAKMEAMMQQYGGGASQGASAAAGQICLSPEMAKRSELPMSKDGKCQPTYTQSGNTATFTYSCQTGTVTSSGKGSASRSGDLVSIISDGTTTTASGTHTMHAEMQMRYLGADCGAVKPADSTK
jgi:hypothetical protein